VDPFVTVVLGASISGLVGYAIHLWRDDMRRTRRVLRRARVVPIAELVDGQLACIVGRVERDREVIVSLMKVQECVAFDTTTHVYEGAGVTTKVTRRLVPFFVVDDTGRARIDAPQAALCNRPVASAADWEERLVEEGATVKLVGSVVIDPTASQTGDHGYREGAWKATLTGTAKFPLLVDVID
jgi:hypothetical protein